MQIKETLITAKQMLCAILALIFPLLGIGIPELGVKANTESEIVRIMSFNVRCAEFDRGKIVPQAVADYLPDSVGLQECEGTWYLSLKAYLPDYQIVGVGRDAGLPLLGESTAIMFRKDKYKLVDWGTFWLSETPNKVSIGWDAKYRRTCTWVILQNRDTGKQYAHINTHLDNVGKIAREKGIEMILDKVASFDMPVVVTGDFNFNSSSSYYKQLTSGVLSDVSKLAENADSGCTMHDYTGRTEGAPIDFICVNEQISSVKTYKIIRDTYDGKYVSDHYPICSDMIF